jgi:hypothetical protein
LPRRVQLRRYPAGVRPELVGGIETSAIKIEGTAMLVLDPWGRAAECDSAIERTADPERRIVLERLKSIWVALCSALSLLEDPGHADQFSVVAQIHTELIAASRTAMH